MRRFFQRQVDATYENTAQPELLFAESCLFQRIVAPDPQQRMEGVAISPSGALIAVALSDTNRVYVYRRRDEGEAGQFEQQPYCRLEGPLSRLDYPHDVAFSPTEDGALLAVAQRSDSISVYRRHEADDQYGPEPVYEIQGPRTELRFSDGVDFLPSGGTQLAACNLETNKITFFEKGRDESCLFNSRPFFVIKDGPVHKPDGLAFSTDGRWLAIANHGAHTVCILGRRDTGTQSEPTFDRKAVAVIRDNSLRYPHSVAFTRNFHHLLVTCAGANYVNLYRCLRGEDRDGSLRWSRYPAQQLLIGHEDDFQIVNAKEKAEGGPKGVAVHENLLAVCRPETHLSLYQVEEDADGLSMKHGVSEG